MIYRSQNRLCHKMGIDYSRPFKVIYFGVSKKPLRDYIQYTCNCGFVYERSEDTANERSENRHFDDPTLI